MPATSIARRIALSACCIRLWREWLACSALRQLHGRCSGSTLQRSPLVPGQRRGLAFRFGLGPWWGLAFALNPAVRFELAISGGGAVALAALMVALAMLLEDRFGLAVIAMTAAVLSREALLLSAAGVFLWSGTGPLRRRITFAGVPAIAAGVWAGYVSVRLGSYASGPAVEELGPPLRGFLDALEAWRVDGGIDLIVGVVYLFFSVVVIVRALRTRALLELATVGFAVLGLLLTRQVWLNHFDITRALSPLATLFALSLGASVFGSGQPREPMKLTTTAGGANGPVSDALNVHDRESL